MATSGVPRIVALKVTHRPSCEKDHYDRVAPFGLKPAGNRVGSSITIEEWERFGIGTISLEMRWSVPLPQTRVLSAAFLQASLDWRRGVADRSDEGKSLIQTPPTSAISAALAVVGSEADAKHIADADLRGIGDVAGNGEVQLSTHQITSTSPLQ